MSESVHPNTIDDKIIYLFSSAPPDRPTYKRGVLNALCYPIEQQVELSYKKSYFGPLLFENRRNLKGRRGVFVFVDYKGDGDDHIFTPIRCVKILGVDPKELAKKYLETTRTYVRVELGKLLMYDPAWNEAIRSVPGRPRPYAQAGSPTYVIEGPDLFGTPGDISQRDIWDGLTEELSKAKSLRGCLFLATFHPRPFRGREPCTLKPYGREQKAYRLRPKNIYRLDLRVYYPQNASIPAKDREINVRSSSELLSVSQAFATAHGGPEDHSVLIECKRTIESTLATLVVDLANSLPDVVAARPQYLLWVRPRLSIVWSFVIFVFLGFTLTSTSKEFYEAWFFCPEIWALGSKVVGAAFLALAAFLAFRKLPSGGSG
jgi:hypothetical protein